jgi:predicted MFS family arabinose efflux permease
MIQTLRQRNFALLWLAGLVSLTGSFMLSVGLKVVVYDMTDSVLAVGGMLLATMLPGILFSAVAGVMVDRWERRRVLVVVNLLLAASILPLLLVRSSDQLWLVYLVGFVQSSLSQFFMPAENAMLPLLSDPKLLPSANALNALNNNLARLLGPAVGGVLVVAGGLEGIILIDALTYVLAAGLALLISVRSHPGKDAVKSWSPRKIMGEWMDGLRIAWEHRTVRALLFMLMLPAISESVMYVLYVPFVTEVLGGDGTTYGALVSAQALGGLVGSLIIGSIATRMHSLHLLAISAIGFGLIDFALFNYPTFLPGVALAFVLLIIAGPFAVGIGSSFQTLIQTNVPDAYRGRVFGTLVLTESVFSLVGIAIASTLSEPLGIVPVINLQAYAYLLVGLMAILLLRERAAKHRETATA